MTPTNSAEEINKPSGGAVGQPAYIELYSGWATTQKGGFLYGRVHQCLKPSALSLAILARLRCGRESLPLLGTLHGAPSESRN
jgi:hypothetical protein